VKHLFRILFTGAILLVSLIIFNAQKSEDIARQGEPPDIEYIELQSAYCSIRIASSSGFHSWRNSVAIKVPVSDQCNDSEFLLRLKNQMEIHRELLPELDHQSGHYLQHHSPFEDPLIA